MGEIEGIEREGAGGKWTHRDCGEGIKRGED